jgi:hypothetical protein
VAVTQQAIYVRKYPSEADFLADAENYIGRGYRIASQSWELGGPSLAGKIFFVLAAVMASLGAVGLITGQPQSVVLFVFALVVLVVAARERVRVLSLTYELEATKL